MTSISKFTSWIEISRKAYSKNIDFFRSRIFDGSELSVVIKANGYGHGIFEIAELAHEKGVGTFCVNSLEEALSLKEKGFFQKILILGPVLLSMTETVVANGFESVCYNIENLMAFEKTAKTIGKPALIHLKVETGTNRQGIKGSKLVEFLDELKLCQNVKLCGVYSHFANIEDTTDHSYAKYQMENFSGALGLVTERGFKDFKVHFASSAAAAIFPETHYDMIRLGISQYGLWSSKETYLTYISEHGHGQEHILTPVLTWKTRIGQIKVAEKGEFVGYGCTKQITRDTKIAVLPIGYSDGYDRKLSNQGYVLIHGRRAPVLGRVAMNLTMVDITDIPEVKLEDEVVLIGEQKDQIIRAEHLAALTGTINYETVARIAPHIPRIIV
ncbi:MAG TPA: alanine racemase [bacterium]|nr:alanine racemase [bacterium]